MGDDLPGVARMRAVALLEAAHPIVLAECFAIATAAAKDATVITGDPEVVSRVSAPAPEARKSGHVSEALA